MSNHAETSWTWSAIEMLFGKMELEQRDFFASFAV